MSPVAAVFVPSPLKTGTKLLHPLLPSIVERVSSGYLHRGKGEYGRVPPTDGGLVPSQTSKDLVAYVDNTAVST